MGWKTSALLAVFLGMVISQFALNNSNEAALDGEYKSTSALIAEGTYYIWKHRQAMREFQADLYSQPNPPLAGKTFVVTGTTTGLGRGIAAHLIALGAQVVLPCRKIPATFVADLVGEAAALRKDLSKSFGNKPPQAAQVSPVVMDLSDLDAVESCAKEIAQKYPHVDGLINNAGLINPGGKNSTQGFELSFAVNFLGPAYFTKLLISSGVLSPAGEEKQRKVSRVVSVTSEEHRVGRKLQGSEKFGSHVSAGMTETMDWYGYSKLAQTTYFLALSNKYSKDELIVHDVCPGPVATDIAGDAGFLGKMVGYLLVLLFQPPLSAALPVLRLALAEEYGQRTGDHYHMAELRLARGDARSVELQQWLLDETDKLIKQRRPS